MNEELAYAERATLLRIIDEQEVQLAMLQGQLATAQAQVQELVARVAELEHRDPPAWAKANRPKPAEPRPARKKRTRHFARRRETPTQTIRHVMERCPDCNAELRGGRVCGRRQVIELPAIAAMVTEHVVVRRWCAQCQRAVTPAPDLSDRVLGQHRVGLRLMGVIAYLREQQRLPVVAIQHYLAEVHQVHLSGGELVAILQTMAQRAQMAVTAIREAVRRSPVVQADETGWRENGQNG